MERFKKEILGSQCFNNVKKIHPNFDEFISKHIKAISGDLLEDGLGIDKEVRKELIENLNVIVNCAASVDFNSRIDEAIRINIYGSLKMMELAKECKSVENFVHVSTCYVNSDKKGVIQEKIYEMSGDPEELIANLMKRNPDELVRDTPKILGTFPNTYTFTKSMAERIMKKRRGDLTVTIVRPSIVGASWKSPNIGWIDTVTAASAIYLLMGLGIQKSIQGDLSAVSDQVPCDFVGDMVIVSGATYANSKDITVVHAGSSARNPCTWMDGVEYTRNYWRTHPPGKRISAPTMHVFKSARMF